MAQYDHLQLVRQPQNFDRRKTGRPGPLPNRDKGYGSRIRGQVDEAVSKQKMQRPKQFVDPSLILRVRMNGLAMESDWEELGLTLLSTDDDNTLVLFSSTDDLTDFKQRIEAYEGPIPDGQKGRRYSGFIDRIDDVGTVEPRDRLGVRLKEAGFVNVENFLDDEAYIVDIELWEFGLAAARRSKAAEIEAFITDQGGDVFDLYSGPSITLIRVSASGKLIRPLLAVPEVAFVDLPPEPDCEASDFIQLSLGEMPPLLPADDDLPVVGILDSGVNDHPLLQDIIIAREAFPPELGDADAWGHGTAVSGVTTLGDLRNQLNQPEIRRVAKIVSAKVVTDQGKFHERRLLPKQMRAAIEKIKIEHNCRLFVISLGDVKARYEHGRVGPWAATLDELARELDVLIFVSAGNRSPRGGNAIEQSRTQYPAYLLEDSNRICEPAGAANVITVGSIANSSGVGPKHQADAHLQPITQELEPSPFTRVGPGAGGIRKPDFIDLGGTMVYDAVGQKLQTAPYLAEAGIITTNSDFLRQMLSSKSGTSFSTPMLAHKAAQLLRRFPTASSNLIKALMVGAAAVPEETDKCLQHQEDPDKVRVYGNGLVDPLKAAYSDDHRVVLYAEDRLMIDQFAVYRIPIPADFQARGRRTIRVSLAYDPPVKRTRAEYTGVRMNFRLIRGCPENDVFDHFRTHAGEEGEAPSIPDRFKCGLKPGPNSRDRNTIQAASVTYVMDTMGYGGEYHLVVRCVGGWAAEQEVGQDFAITVELEHHEGVQLYAQLRQRVRLR